MEWLILDDIVADAAFETHARGAAVNHDRAASFVAKVNGELIYRAIENVVRNAVKYTADGTQVCVISRIENDVLRITISDEGHGVPSADLSRIFHPFSSGEAARITGGYGLAGLSPEEVRTLTELLQRIHANLTGC